MKPFAKTFGWIGAIGAVAAAVGVGVKTGDWTGLAPALGAIIALFSHSATGDGGKTQ